MLVVCNGALLLVDHVHFQYNGALLGLLLLSLTAHLSHRFLVGGFLFAVLLNCKHLYLVLAPVQFVFILRGWVWGKRCGQRFAAMAAVVAAVFAASFAPFILTGQLPNIISRCAETPSVQFSMRTGKAGQGNSSVRCRPVGLMRALRVQAFPIPERPAACVLGAQRLGPLCSD